MGHSVERLTEIKYPNVDLAFSIPVIREFISGKQKLRLKGVTLAESVIGQCQDTIVI